MRTRTALILFCGIYAVACDQAAPPMEGPAGQGAPPGADVAAARAAAATPEVATWSTSDSAGDTLLVGRDKNERVVAQLRLRRNPDGSIDITGEEPFPGKVTLGADGKVAGDGPGPLRALVDSFVKSQPPAVAPPQAKEKDPAVAQISSALSQTVTSECTSGHWEVTFVFPFGPVIYWRCDSYRTCTNYAGDCTGTTIFPWQRSPVRCVSSASGAVKCVDSWNQYPWITECSDGFKNQGAGACLF
jgi:hypothetical protein